MTKIILIFTGVVLLNALALATLVYQVFRKPAELIKLPNWIGGEK